MEIAFLLKTVIVHIDQMFSNSTHQVRAHIVHFVQNVFKKHSSGARAQESGLTEARLRQLLQQVSNSTKLHQ